MNIKSRHLLLTEKTRRPGVVLEHLQDDVVGCQVGLVLIGLDAVAPFDGHAKDGVRAEEGNYVE